MIPKRVDEMTSFIVMDVLEEAQRMERAGIDVIHLEVGEPDFEVPECVSAQSAERSRMAIPITLTVSA
jgi:aspartate/methionine/tyrosine aminotransferase